MGRLLWLAAALGAAGCGSASAPPTVDAFADKLTSVTVAGKGTISWPLTAKLTATAAFTSGRMLDISNVATWSSDTAAAATVDNDGVVTSADAGSTTIHATYEGVEGTLPVTVTMPLLAVSAFNSHGIDFFPANATGNVAPVRSIRGALTTLASPGQIAATDTELFVVDQSAAIIVFDKNASGNVAPLRRISGNLTTLSSASGIALSDTDIFVGDQTTKVAVFPKSGNGNIAPSRSITSAGLGSTLGLATTSDELYVTSYSANVITVFPLASNGTTIPTRVISGTNTAMSGPHGITLANDELFISNAFGNAMTVMDPKANGNASPYRVVSGAMTSLSYTDDIAVLGNRVYTANYSNSTIQVFDIAASGNATPIATIGGAMTLMDGPFGFGMVQP